MDLSKPKQFNTSSPLKKLCNFMHLPTPILPRKEPLEIGVDCMFSHHIQFERQLLQFFWQHQMLDIKQSKEFKQHHLPLTRIKKIMKSDEDVKMVSADAPILFSKACELFILELTLRSWLYTEEYKRRTLQRNDIANAISHGDILDFLIDIVPDFETMEEDALKCVEGTKTFPLVDGVMNVDHFRKYVNEEFINKYGDISPQNMGHPLRSFTHFTSDPYTQLKDKKGDGS